MRMKQIYALAALAVAVISISHGGAGQDDGARSSTQSSGGGAVHFRRVLELSAGG